MKELIFCVLLGFSNLAFSNEINQILTLDEVFDSEFFQKLENVNEEEIASYVLQNWDSKDIILLKKGTTFPVKIFLKGGYFQLTTKEESCPMVTLKKDLYLQIKNNDFFFSEDLKKINSAFEFFTGSCCLKIARSPNSAAQVEIGADINKR